MIESFWAWVGPMTVEYLLLVVLNLFATIFGAILMHRAFKNWMAEETSIRFSAPSLHPVNSNAEKAARIWRHARSFLPYGFVIFAALAAIKTMAALAPSVADLQPFLGMTQ